MDPLDDEEMIVCPYNPIHRMLRKRLQQHLLKCRANHPDVERQICPFNRTHHIPIPEFSYHVTNCPDRKLLNQYIYDAPIPKDEEKVQHAPIECDEDWDDTEAVDYDPQKYAKNANVLRKPESFRPAERKNFCKMERERLADKMMFDVKTENDSEEDENGERPSMPPTPPPPVIADWKPIKKEEPQPSSIQERRDDRSSNIKREHESHNSVGERRVREAKREFSPGRQGVKREYNSGPIKREFNPGEGKREHNPGSIKPEYSPVERKREREYSPVRGKREYSPVRANREAFSPKTEKREFIPRSSRPVPVAPKREYSPEQYGSRRGRY